MPGPEHCLNCVSWGNHDDERRRRAVRLCKVHGRWQSGRDGCKKWANVMRIRVRDEGGK